MFVDTVIFLLGVAYSWGGVPHVWKRPRVWGFSDLVPLKTNRPEKYFLLVQAPDATAPGGMLRAVMRHILSVSPLPFPLLRQH